MYTYNFIYWTKTGECKQVDINAESEDKAWRQFMNIPDEITYVDLMEPKESKLLTSEFLEQFLLEAQHYSGLSLFNPISVHYTQGLSMAAFSDDLLPTIMGDLIAGYMSLVHEVHRKTKTWKSYDW